MRQGVRQVHPGYTVNANQGGRAFPAGEAQSPAGKPQSFAVVWDRIVEAFQLVQDVAQSCGRRRQSLLILVVPEDLDSTLSQGQGVIEAMLPDPKHSQASVEVCTRPLRDRWGFCDPQSLRIL